MDIVLFAVVAALGVAVMVSRSELKNTKKELDSLYVLVAEIMTDDRALEQKRDLFRMEFDDLFLSRGGEYADYEVHKAFWSGQAFSALGAARFLNLGGEKGMYWQTRDSLAIFFHVKATAPRE